jgi:hypothetical protein
MRLAGMADAWLEQQQSAKTTKMDFDERFGLLVDAEHLHRENRKRDRRLKDAKLRQGGASLEDFDDPAAGSTRHCFVALQLAPGLTSAFTW